MTYYVEFNQTDPPDSPSPGCGHYAGEVTGFTTPDEARDVGIAALGKPCPPERFYPCCGWQKQETPITGYIVYWEDGDGNRTEDKIYFQGSV